MADASVNATRLKRLLDSLGWTATASRFTVSVEEPAIDPIRHTWMVGQSRALLEAGVATVRPSRIIVEDFAPKENIARLQDSMGGLGIEPKVVTYTHFVDTLWGADTALQRAFQDAAMDDADIDFDALVPAPDPDARHVTQTLDFGNHKAPDHRALDLGLPDRGTCLAVLADAGLGKSEFLKWHEWRYAVLYQAALRSKERLTLPPIALRVSLRGLRSVSLDFIAHTLSQPVERGIEISLPRISSGSFLRELVLEQRLILLLDGLDEVAATSERLDEDLVALRRVVAAGGRVVLTSRAAHATSRGAISQRFRPDEIAHLLPLDQDGQEELLVKRGVPRAQAQQLIRRMAGAAQGIPLFLILAHAVNLDDSLTQEESESRTRVLMKLLKLFCERDQSRIGLDADEQMSLLAEVAEWLMVDDRLSRDQLLQAIGLGDDDPESAILMSPHALLFVDDDRVKFKYSEFGALFKAIALSRAWTRYGLSSIHDLLKRSRLDDGVVEYLARLVGAETIAGAWATTGEDQSMDSAMLRRNLLGIALAMVDDDPSLTQESARSFRLGRILGSRELVRVGMAGLVFERYDFAGWRMKKLHGRGGALRYCRNLEHVDRDESVVRLSLEGCSFDEKQQDPEQRARGVDRLSKLIRPLRRKNGPGIIGIMSVSEAFDPLAWGRLVHFKLAVRQGKAAASKWSLTPAGIGLLSSFRAAEQEGGRALRALVETDHQLSELVDDLGNV